MILGIFIILLFVLEHYQGSGYGSVMTEHSGVLEAPSFRQKAMKGPCLWSSV